VSRTFAKMCPALGIEKEVFSVHHKKHISKVMAHATVGYCFTGSPENGGDACLIQLQRCQAFKVAQKAYRGKGGKAIVKGDCLLTDCNVTGTDTGTPDKPKFALRPLWEFCLLPSLDALVGPGGHCEGAVVVHQEDNAGTTFNTLSCDTKNYYILLLQDLIKREASTNGSPQNSRIEAGTWSYKHHKGHTPTCWTSRYSPPCPKNILNYSKSTVIPKLTTNEFGRLHLRSGKA